MVVKIVINVSSSNVDQEYTYLLPKALETTAKIGSRVVVSFGKANRLVMGYILDICEESKYQGELKEIEEILDYEPLISPNQIALAKQIRDETICPLVRILNLMIPSGLVLKTSKYLTITNYHAIDEKLAVLFEKSETILYTKTLWPYDSKIAKEVKNHNITISYEAKPKIRVKTISKYVLNPTFAYQYRNELRSIRQIEFLENIQDEVAMTAFDLSEKYEISEGIIQTLSKKGYLQKIEEPVSRIVVRDIPITKRIRETKNQNVAHVLTALQTSEKPLLYLPKDESEQLETIYQIINTNQKNNQNVVIVVPEILSSYRISNIIRKKTGLSVGVLNSTLASGEILDEFNAIKEDKYRVIVTTSSGALFPYQNVGTFILMNVESDNYYNDQSPRYNLKQVMVNYAMMLMAKIILMTFVPSIIDYSYGLKNYYQIIESENNNQLNVEVVDLKEELRKGNNTPISRSLEKAFTENAKNQNLTMLIVNNKSYSSYVMCRSCGNTFVCPKCKISLQYNKKNNVLICPSCSNKIPFTNECDKCHSRDLKMGGFGMEQVAEVIKERYPNLRTKILRESSYEEYYNVMAQIEEKEIDVIITSSILSTNVDSDSIATIAIINLDSVAKSATIDANERAYAMLVQAKQRLNKKETAKMIVQTYNPDDTVLNDFLSTDYHGFLKKELSIRKVLKNEPFYYMNRIIVKGKYETMFKEANSIKKHLQDLLGNNVFVIGPTYNYQYQGVQIIIKHRLNDISRFYKEIYEKYQTTSTTIIVDRYPKYM